MPRIVLWMRSLVVFDRVAKRRSELNQDVCRYRLRLVIDSAGDPPDRSLLDESIVIL